MKKVFPLAVAALLALGCLTACGGSQDDGPDVPPDADITEQVTIRFWGWGDAAEQANYQRLVNQFMEENENIIVAYNGMDSGIYMQELRNASTNLPELFYMPDYDFLEYAANGMLKDVSNYVTDEELSAIWPQAVDEYYFNPRNNQLGKSEGAKLYGLPKDLGPFTLVYNKTLVDSQIQKLGLNREEIYGYLDPTTPMTWQQFRSLLKKLDPDPNDNLYGISHYEIEAAVYSNNANFFNDDASQQRITDPNFTDALQFIADLALVDHTMVEAKNQASTNGFQRFIASGCIFSFMGPWDCAQFWELDGLNFESNILPVPYNGENPDARSTAWVGSMGYCVSAKANSLKTNAAMRLAKYLCYNVDAQRKFYELGQQVPNIMEMAKDEYVNDTRGLIGDKDPADRSVWLDTIDGFSDTDKIGGKVRPRYYTYSSDWYDMFTEYIDTQGLWTGAKTAADICAAYSKTFQAALNEMRANLG